MFEDERNQRAKEQLDNYDPKLAAGSIKVSLDNVSIVAGYYEAAVMAKGAIDYDAYNWTKNRMKASTYYNAILRHLNAWWIGEDRDLKSKLPHMAHIRANTGIILDQQAAGRMIDDRPKTLAPIEPIVREILRAAKLELPLVVGKSRTATEVKERMSQASQNLHDAAQAIAEDLVNERADKGAPVPDEGSTEQRISDALSRFSDKPEFPPWQESKSGCD